MIDIRKARPARAEGKSGARVVSVAIESHIMQIYALKTRRKTSENSGKKLQKIRKKTGIL